MKRTMDQKKRKKKSPKEKVIKGQRTPKSHTRK